MTASVAITIDVEYGDRPGAAPEDLGAMVAAARHFDVPVTLFVEGRWARAHPATLRHAVEEMPAGSLIGMHGYSHVAFDLLSESGVEEEIAECYAALDAVVSPASLLRLPYGRGWQQPAVRAVLDRLGVEVVGWDVGLYDWDAGTPFEAAVARSDELWSRGGVVLLHQWPRRSPRLLEVMVERGLAAGACFVPLDPCELPREVTSGKTPPRSE